MHGYVTCMLGKSWIFAVQQLHSEVIKEARGNA